VNGGRRRQCARSGRRFFADHPIPRDTATLVLFDGKLAPFYKSNQTIRGAIARAGLFRARNSAAAPVMDSSTTSRTKRSWTSWARPRWRRPPRAGRRRRRCGGLFAGLRHGDYAGPEPPLHADTPRDALGLPKLKLHMRIADSDFARSARR